MSEAKHTPGPWTKNMRGYLIGSDGSEVVAASLGIALAGDVGDGVRIANGRLISAAPDLLDAIQSIVKSLADQDDEGMIEHAETMIAARTAIAKATGQKQ